MDRIPRPPPLSLSHLPDHVNGANYPLYLLRLVDAAAARDVDVGEGFGGRPGPVADVASEISNARTSVAITT